MRKVRSRDDDGRRLRALEEQIEDHERRLVQLERTFTRILAALLFIAAEIPAVVAALLKAFGH